MLQSIVGPPIVGVADFKSMDKIRDQKSNGSDSFAKTLKDQPTSRKREDAAIKSGGSQQTIADRVPRPEPKSEAKVETREDTRADSMERRSEDRDRLESEETRGKPVAQDKEGIVNKGAQQRQQAILKFMDSFESEFGVPPTRIVEAMAKLKPQDQLESPEDTVNQVVGQLDLNDEQGDRAKGMYSGLLAQLNQIDQQNVMKPPVPEKPMFHGHDLGVVETKGRFAAETQKRQALNQSLDHMNQRFWMKDAMAASSQGNVTHEGLAEKLAQMSLREKMGMAPQSIDVDEAGFQNPMNPMNRMAGAAVAGGAVTEASLPDNNDETSPEDALAGLAAALRAARAQEGRSDIEADESMRGIDREDPDISEGPGHATIGAPVHMGMKGAAEADSQAAAPIQGRQQNFSGHHPQHGGGEGFNSSMHSAKGEMLEKAKASSKADFQKVMAGDESARTSDAKPIATPAAEEPMVANVNPHPSPKDTEANVRQIMNQAQYLIKKGGGEMKVEMTPEGLGQVHMKVAVQDGKVNVQMAASTPEAKKVLESGLSELKNSLAAHKLSMDHVKVDVVNRTNTDNSAQNQQMQQNPREQTRQFWNHFSDSFGSSSQQREPFTDIAPNLRGYPHARGDEPLKPVAASAAKYASIGKGRGLDLVA